MDILPYINTVVFASLQGSKKGGRWHLPRTQLFRGANSPVEYILALFGSKTALLYPDGAKQEKGFDMTNFDQQHFILPPMTLNL